jgi:uncharacterized YigZ family protein
MTDEPTWTEPGPSYPVPAGRCRIELTERRSRFIATVERTPTVEDARAFLDEMRSEFADASHNVYAFAVGHGASVTHGMSDDGEPSGTAGRPVLAVVQGCGLGDVCVVVTRYFGGTKLGTGGLVRAYTVAAQAVLADVPRTIREERRSVEMVVEYGYYESCKRLVDRHDGLIEHEDFGANVAVRASFGAGRLAGFADELAEATSGRVVPRPVD